MRHTPALLSVLISAALLTACGGGGGSSKNSSNNSGSENSGNSVTLDTVSYTGSTDTAELTTDNQDAVATDAGKAVLAMINRADSEELVSGIQGMRASANSNTLTGECGGTAQVSGSGDENNNSYSIRYSSYCTPIDEDELVMNGLISGSNRTSGSTSTIHIDYDNITMTLGGDSVGIDGYADAVIISGDNYQNSYSARFNMTYNGETHLTAWDITCSSERCVYSSYFVSNNEVYKTSNYSLYEDGYGYYQLETTLYLPEYGQVELTGTDIELCEDGSDIASGTLEITGANNKTMEVVYSGCGVATVTLNGNANLLSK